jgi:hypothetical protein
MTGEAGFPTEASGNDGPMTDQYCVIPEIFCRESNFLKPTLGFPTEAFGNDGGGWIPDRTTRE